MVVAPSPMATSTTRQRKSGSVRLASSAENSTSSVKVRARLTPARVISRASSRSIRSLSRRWRYDVDRKTWSRGRAAPATGLLKRTAPRTLGSAAPGDSGRLYLRCCLTRHAANPPPDKRERKTDDTKEEQLLSHDVVRSGCRAPASIVYTASVKARGRSRGLSRGPPRLLRLDGPPPGA